MKCEYCIAEGKTSRVYDKDVVTKNVHEIHRFYDEDGKRHDHGNYRERYVLYKCTNRHVWKVITKPGYACCKVEAYSETVRLDDTSAPPVPETIRTVRPQ
jgi:hypothetical protein